MRIDNPPVHPSPASQIEGITLFDTLVLTLLSSHEDLTNYEIFDLAKAFLHLRNIAIQNLDNFKSMDQIMKEEEDNEYNEKN